MRTSAKVNCTLPQRTRKPAGRGVLLSAAPANSRFPAFLGMSVQRIVIEPALHARCGSEQAVFWGVEFPDAPVLPLLDIVRWLSCVLLLRLLRPHRHLHRHTMYKRGLYKQEALKAVLRVQTPLQVAQFGLIADRLYTKSGLDA